jgi:hypothetical protein
MGDKRPRASAEPDASPAYRQSDSAARPGGLINMNESAFFAFERGELRTAKVELFGIISNALIHI